MLESGFQAVGKFGAERPRPLVGSWRQDPLERRARCRDGQRAGIGRAAGGNAARLDIMQSIFSLASRQLGCVVKKK